MKKFIKVLSQVIIVLFVVIFVTTVFDYYRAPLPIFFGVEEGDELIKSGETVYMIRKDTYERGDIVVANDVSWKDRKKYQVSRKIVGLPGEYVEDGGISLDDDQYAVRTAITNGELTSTYRDVIPAANIYGIIIGTPLTDFKSRFSYFINRTKYIPEYIKLKLSSSYLSLSNREVPTEIPIINRTIAVVNRNEQGFVVEYKVGAGMNLWELIKEELLLRNSSKMEKELTVEVDRIKDELKALSSDDLIKLGFSSGNVSILMVGDTIKVLQILEHYMN